MRRESVAERLWICGNTPERFTAQRLSRHLDRFSVTQGQKNRKFFETILRSHLAWVSEKAKACIEPSSLTFRKQENIVRKQLNWKIPVLGVVLFLAGLFILIICRSFSIQVSRENMATMGPGSILIWRIHVLEYCL